MEGLAEHYRTEQTNPSIPCSTTPAREPCVDPCHKEMMKVGMPRAELYFEQQEPGSHNCQVHAINNAHGDCLLTTRMLHNFIRNKALEDPERATGWKATYNENQGFSDDAVDALLSTQKSLSLWASKKYTNYQINAQTLIKSSKTRQLPTAATPSFAEGKTTALPSQNTKTPGNS